MGTSGEMGLCRKTSKILQLTCEQLFGLSKNKFYESSAGPVCQAQHCVDFDFQVLVAPKEPVVIA